MFANFIFVFLGQIGPNLGHIGMVYQKLVFDLIFYHIPTNITKKTFLFLGLSMCLTNSYVTIFYFYSEFKRCKMRPVDLTTFHFFSLSTLWHVRST